MQAPVVVLNTRTKRETGREAQLGNILAAKTVADVIRTCLGPKAMLKMVLDPMGGIALTNDGNAILREIDVNHPAAKSMIELSRAQDENVGDGTTSVVILAGELLQLSESCLMRNLHPTVIISSYFKALEDSLEALGKCTIKVDTSNRTQTLGVIASCIGTKFIGQWSELMCSLALDAVETVKVDLSAERRDIDLKKYARVEKVGGRVFSISSRFNSSEKIIPPPPTDTRGGRVGVQGGEGGDTEQGRDAREDEEEDSEPASCAAGLPARVQEGGEPDQRGVPQG
jgi:T-complex protein 1 subunit gamma